jgi:hypothetical protein
VSSKTVRRDTTHSPVEGVSRLVEVPMAKQLRKSLAEASWIQLVFEMDRCHRQLVVPRQLRDSSPWAGMPYEARRRSVIDVPCWRNGGRLEQVSMEKTRRQKSGREETLHCLPVLPTLPIRPTMEAAIHESYNERTFILRKTTILFHTLRTLLLP